jgi:hypothetical protein
LEQILSLEILTSGPKPDKSFATSVSLNCAPGLEYSAGSKHHPELASSALQTAQPSFAENVQFVDIGSKSDLTLHPRSVCPNIQLPAISWSKRLGQFV